MPRFSPARRRQRIHAINPEQDQSLHMVPHTSDHQMFTPRVTEKLHAERELHHPGSLKDSIAPIPASMSWLAPVDFLIERKKLPACDPAEVWP